MRRLLSHLSMFGLALAYLVCTPAELLGQGANEKKNLTDPVLLQPETPEQLINLERTVQDSIEAALPAIVSIGNRFGRKDAELVSMEGRRFGSGVIISEDGLVLCQYHVSHEGVYDKTVGLTAYGQIGDKVEVVLSDGRRVTGELLGGDRLADISLVKIVEPGPYSFGSLSSRERVQLGQWTIKLGHPTGYQPSRGVSVRLGRVVYANDVDLVSSCRTHPGDSGGPTIDLNTEIIGLVKDSYIPPTIAKMGELRGSSWSSWNSYGAEWTVMSYMTARRIREQLDPIRTTIVRDTMYRDHVQRTKQYEAVKETLEPKLCDVDLGLQAAYSERVKSAAESVVEVLNPDKSRSAIGTVVSHDGLIVTQASRLLPYPLCRLQNGNVLIAQILGKDDELDLALLKISAPTQPVPWSHQVDMKRGTFLLAPTREMKWGIGILSAPIHEDGRGFETPSNRAGGQRERTWPVVFEHDIPLDDRSLGGPVLNLNGQAVGISIAEAGDHGYLAIPSQKVIAAIAKLQLRQ